jgi:adenosylhomocysteine nucleosidase
MNRERIGIVTGLTAEARWLKRAGFMVRAGGGTPHGAERAAEMLVAEGAQALISFGLAGGLKPGLKPGALLVPPAVIEGNNIYVCDYALMAFLGGSTGAIMMAGNKIVATVHHKALLYRRSHPAAIDLESGAVARVARTHSMAFAVLRAVADPATMELPPAALVALRDDGSVDMGKLTLSVLGNPGQLKRLVELGFAAKKARAGLLERVKGLPERVPGIGPMLYLPSS